MDQTKRWKAEGLGQDDAAAGNKETWWTLGGVLVALQPQASFNKVLAKRLQGGHRVWW